MNSRGKFIQKKLFLYKKTLLTFINFTEQVGLVIQFMYIGKSSNKAVKTLATEVMKKLGRTLEKGA